MWSLRDMHTYQDFEHLVPSTETKFVGCSNSALWYFWRLENVSELMHGYTNATGDISMQKYHLLTNIETGEKSERFQSTRLLFYVYLSSKQQLFCFFKHFIHEQ